MERRPDIGVDTMLSQLVAGPLGQAFSIDLRGEGASRFLYVVGARGAAEVSWHGEGFWIQFWDSLDPDAQPTGELVTRSVGGVEKALRARL